MHCASIVFPVRHSLAGSNQDLLRNSLIGQVVRHAINSEHVTALHSSITTMQRHYSASTQTQSKILQPDVMLPHSTTNKTQLFFDGLAVLGLTSTRLISTACILQKFNLGFFALSVLSARLLPNSI